MQRVGNEALGRPSLGTGLYLFPAWEISAAFICPLSLDLYTEVTVTCVTRLLWRIKVEVKVVCDQLERVLGNADLSWLFPFHQLSSYHIGVHLCGSSCVLAASLLVSSA